ncbi:MAG TPA: hypothetical protein VK801_02990 [Caulobacteraceae bacterium]|jgi:hypothetical protein|nr:hypothetical protein [Caulobacteraceae bacterium]
MADGWIDNGPVSLPPRTLAYGAGALVLVLAVVGGGLGFDAAWRRQAGPELNATGPANEPGDLVAKPIVEIAPPTPAPEESKDEDTADNQANDEAKADALTAEAQANQGKDAKSDIDQIMASPTEKPPAPVKGPPEAPPGTAPVKSDVPF